MGFKAGGLLLVLVAAPPPEESQYPEESKSQENVAKTAWHLADRLPNADPIQLHWLVPGWEPRHSAKQVEKIKCTHVAVNARPATTEGTDRSRIARIYLLQSELLMKGMEVVVLLS
jgi:hypothetical protein